MENSKFKNFNSKLNVISFSILGFILLFMFSTCKKEVNEKVEGKNYRIVFYDSFSNKPIEGMKVNLVRSICPLLSSCDHFYLDTCISDSTGSIYFSLTSEQLEKIHQFDIRPINYPEIYISPRYISGNEFDYLNSNRTINMIPACFLEIREIDIFPMGSKSCNFYNLNILKPSFTQEVIRWKDTDPIKSSKYYVKTIPSTDTFKATFGCNLYRDTQIQIINTLPFDTLKISDYFHP